MRSRIKGEDGITGFFQEEYGLRQQRILDEIADAHIDFFERRYEKAAAHLETAALICRSLKSMQPQLGET